MVRVSCSLVISLLFTTIATFIAGCSSIDRSNADDQKGLPTGFDRHAGYVTFDGFNTPSFHAISTVRPVLHFSGHNADNSAIAYTTLGKTNRASQVGFTQIDQVDSTTLSLNDLVPTGEMVIESKNKIAHVVSKDGAVIISASWHQTDPNLIAYSFSEIGNSGIAVFDLRTEISSVIVNGAITPDYLVWNDDGNSVGAFMEDGSLPTRIAEDGTPVAGRRLQFASLNSGEYTDTLSVAQGSVRFSNQLAALDITLDNGSIIALDETIGQKSATLKTSSGLTTFRADQVRFRSTKGITFVNFDGDNMSLMATNGSATIAPAAAATTVTYYIPMHVAEKPVSITQVGTGFGGGCRVSSHTGKLQYGIDFQITSPYNGDEIIAAANGTVSGGVPGVTCNAIDTGADGTACSIYRSPCSCNGGWGNYIIISHSDGRYTMYGHLENRNYKPTRCGPVSRGCWIANEGGTGNSSGGKNGCGDHLHFQWQDANTTSANSLSGSFADAPAIGTGSCTSQNPVTGIMSCSL